MARLRLTKGSDTHPIARAYERVLTFLKTVVTGFIEGLDVVVFIAIFAPLCIQLAMAVIRSQMDDNEQMTDLLANHQVAGIVDYVVAVYTAVLGYIMLLWRHALKIAIPGIKATSSRTLSEFEHCSKFIVYLVMLAAGIIAFGLAARPSVIVGHANRDIELGHILTGPSKSSPITYYRFFVLAPGGWYLARNGREASRAPTESDKTDAKEE